MARAIKWTADMKIKSTKTQQIYEVILTRQGENHHPCPECSKDRKHKSAKSFSFNVVKGQGKCFNCDASFFEYREPVQKKEYQVPQWKNRTELTEKAAIWMRGRMILDETINAMAISSAVELMPQTGKDENVICFPYFRAGNLVNVKYRSAAKHFKLCKNAELILYNLDSLQGQKTALIVEGEIDCLSFIQSGIKNVVSVPNGAGGTSMEYIDNCFNELEPIEKFYIAADNDTAGYKLREELVRRLGAERCAIISYGDCKDANEYLTKHGGFELCGLIATAQDVPVEGVVCCSDIRDDIYDLYLHGFQPGAKLNIAELDELVTWVTGRLVVVTGIPGHGKSEVTDWLIVLLNLLHGWKTAYFSPENHPLSYHVGKITSKLTGKSFDSHYLNHDEFEQSYQYMNENFMFINPEQDLTIDSILEKAKYLVRKIGIKILVIDPFNKLDHLQDRGENETQYISRFLDRLTNFARINGVLVFLVAHPRKMQNKKDEPSKYEVPTLYDINGSANFFNKCDYGLTIYRDRQNEVVSIMVQKVKFKHWGKVGQIDLKYNQINGRLYLPYKEATFENYIVNGIQPATEIVQNYDNEIAPF
jgi:twinkle protein